MFFLSIQLIVILVHARTHAHSHTHTHRVSVHVCEKEREREIYSTFLFFEIPNSDTSGTARLNLNDSSLKDVSICPWKH